MATTATAACGLVVLAAPNELQTDITQEVGRSTAGIVKAAAEGCHEDDVLSQLSGDVWTVLDDEGEDLSFTPDGCYVEYRNGERIAEAIRATGIPCIKDDELIKQAQGPYM